MTYPDLNRGAAPHVARPTGASPSYRLIDTFPAFLEYWERSKRFPWDRRIDGWANDYLARWPELRALQIHQYHKEHVSWYRIARRRIFPRLDARLPTMRRIHAQILARVGDVFTRAGTAFDLGFEPCFVVHVGIGLGAGWATTYEGGKAVLFGLENAAEMGWARRRDVEALIAHELGHLAHQEWRARSGLRERPVRAGPYWQLYEEGFATRFEKEVTGHVRWPTQSGWLDWCQRNRGGLAAAFLRAAKHRRPARRFFGSWYRIHGHAESGYYLGYEVVGRWRERLALRDIAAVAESAVRHRSRRVLEEWAGRFE